MTGQLYSTLKDNELHKSVTKEIDLNVNFQNSISASLS